MKFPLTDDQKKALRKKIAELDAAGEAEPYTEQELKDVENETETPGEKEIKKLEAQKK